VRTGGGRKGAKESEKKRKESCACMHVACLSACCSFPFLSLSLLSMSLLLISSFSSQLFNFGFISVALFPLPPSPLSFSLHSLSRIHIPPHTFLQRIFISFLRAQNPSFSAPNKSTQKAQISVCFSKSIRTTVHCKEEIFCQVPFCERGSVPFLGLLHAHTLPTLLRISFSSLFPTVQ